MASDKNDISEIVKKCKILLLDIEGTTTSISFVKDKLFPYAEANVKEFLESQWESEDVKGAVEALRKLAVEDAAQMVEGVVAIPGEDAGKEEQIDGLVKSVKWQMSVDRKAGPLKQLQGLIWKQGYDKGDIKGHVYDDVAPALALWNSTEGQKVYIYSSGSVQAQKLLFNQSLAGDLLPHIEGHFDTDVGPKQEAASYAAIVEKIGSKPEEILFLTDIVKEAEAARTSGLQTALVTRVGNAPLPDDAIASYPVLQSFNQLTVTNKRKPEPQEEEVPAKVPKTDVEENVKTATEMEVPETITEAVPGPVSSSETVAPSESNIAKVETASNGPEPEKMEVEEETPIAESVPAAKQTEEPTRIETVIEGVSASTVESDAPDSDANPVIIEESVEKTDKNETTTMETASTENIESIETASESNDQEEEKQSALVTEETSTVEIQEVTDDQDNAGDGKELVDSVPIVEEPPSVEMEDLNNVVEALDRECDEILNKVNDFTNLDNIPVKPLLNSIGEENIADENGENTNDIVDSILDSEMKPCDDIDINIVQDISDRKASVDEVKPNKVEDNKELNDELEEKAAEDTVDENVTNEINAEAEKATVSSTDTAVEVVTEEKVAPTEVTNGETQELPVDVCSESESVTVVDNSESKEVTEKGSVAEPEDNKMESDERAVEAVETNESKMVIADSTEKPVEIEKESKQTTETSVETKEAIDEQINNKIESEATLEKAKVDGDVKESSPEQVDNKTESQETVVESVENMESESSLPQQSQVTESIAEPETASERKIDNEASAPKVPEVETELKENSSINDVQMETEATEKVNGNTNGDADVAEVNQNGDASKEEELSARLSVENGDSGKEMNGANGNGNSSEVEMRQDDNKVETEIADIKVKTISTEEPRTDPIEQPVEA